MAGNVKPHPEGYHTITPDIVVRDAAGAIEFYKKALGAKQLGGVFQAPDGKVMHAELQIGDSRVMLADEFPGRGSCQSPQTLGGSTTSLMIYSENVDRLFNQAVSAGASVVMPLDPYGHFWALGQHVEDVAPDEMERRGKEFFAKMAKGAATKQAVS